MAFLYIFNKRHHARTVKDNTPRLVIVSVWVVVGYKYSACRFTVETVDLFRLSGIRLDALMAVCLDVFIHLYSFTVNKRAGELLLHNNNNNCSIIIITTTMWSIITSFFY